MPSSDGPAADERPMRPPQRELAVMRPLARQFPNIDAAYAEIARLSAILSLPMGAIHIISDVHGRAPQAAACHQQRLRHAAAAVRARDWLPLGGRAVGTRLLGSNGSSTAATFWRPRARATGSRTPAGDNDGPLARPDTQILGATGYPGVDSTHPQRCPF